jgi:arginyl-tRNA--protein-N-Asp/Glu arginylyltransferase
VEERGLWHWEAVINDAFMMERVPAELMDRLWAAGWRHFGALFFRYGTQEDEAGGVDVIWPLRIDLERFEFSKSQRRVLRRNADVEVVFQPAQRSEEAEALFERHKGRFTRNVPEGLGSFLSAEPAVVPCECVECRVTLGGALVALSFLDVGVEASSSVYGVFEPELGRRSLGVLTMLKEIEHSRVRGCRWYYPGYATQGSSAYDYKKQFGALEFLDWESGEWRELRGA